jgi:hypothetical protein
MISTLDRMLASTSVSKCYNKALLTGLFYSSKFWNQEVQDQGIVPHRSCCSVSLHVEGNKLPQAAFTRAPIPFLRALPSWPHHLLKVPPLKSIVWRARFNMWMGKGGTSLQSTAQFSHAPFTSGTETNCLSVFWTQALVLAIPSARNAEPQIFTGWVLLMGPLCLTWPAHAAAVLYHDTFIWIGLHVWHDSYVFTGLPSVFTRDCSYTEAESSVWYMFLWIFSAMEVTECPTKVNSIILILYICILRPRDSK